MPPEFWFPQSDVEIWLPLLTIPTPGSTWRGTAVAWRVACRSAMLGGSRDPSFTTAVSRMSTYACPPIRSRCWDLPAARSGRCRSASCWSWGCRSRTPRGSVRFAAARPARAFAVRGTLGATPMRLVREQVPGLRRRRTPRPHQPGVPPERREGTRSPKNLNPRVEIAGCANRILRTRQVRESLSHSWPATLHCVRHYVPASFKCLLKKSSTRRQASRSTCSRVK